MYLRMLSGARHRAVLSGACFGALCGLAGPRAFGQSFEDTIGLTQLRAADPTLTGAGVIVAQPEASLTQGGTDFEVNPANSGVNQPASLFSYSSSNGAASGIGPPNAAGSESGHANAVASVFYGNPSGLAPGVSHVFNTQADFFFSNIIQPQATMTAQVVNQSFSFGTQDASVDLAFDHYAARYGTIFVSAVGGEGLDNNQPTSPGTMYNGISVNVFLGTGTNTAGAPVGPTTDGRSKPDITAPAPPQGGDTSYSTPEVAGAAAILVQAANRGDGGAGTAALASDLRTIKALMLNSAQKPSDWTHTQTAPLDTRYGAGVLDVWLADQNLVAGQHAFIATNTVTHGAAHLPVSNSSNEPSLVGWDNNTITSSVSNDAINHYFFNLTGSPTFQYNATLDWNLGAAQTAINNLDLFLYNATTNALVDQSISTIDNVQQLYEPNLPAGRYDLEVLKVGGVDEVTPQETYGLAYSAFSTPEPSGLLLVAGAGVMLMTRRRSTGRASQATRLNGDDGAPP